MNGLMKIQKKVIEMVRLVYHELFPTCPRCKNESLIIRSGLLGNYFTCDQCGFDEPIDILLHIDEEEED